MEDPDTSPPVPCTEDCCRRPFSCPCPDDEEGCQLERLGAIAPKVRGEVEMPPRGS